MTVKEVVLTELSKIIDPVSKKDIVNANLLKALNVDEKKISIVLEIDPNIEPEYQKIKSNLEVNISKLFANHQVKVLLTAHINKIDPKDSKDEPKLKIGRHPDPQAKKIKPPQVKKIVAIASGKGGVGKSTVSANLAIALAKKGNKVGLLDADIYGPSQPMMMGVNGKPQMGGENGKMIVPLKNYGVTMISMGLLVPPKEAIVWRGPMLMGALQQFIGQVDWGELDILIIDLPPGTGDVQLTLAQKCEINGAVIVSTPQDVALIDAIKAMHMFYKLQVPIVGLIENMSSFVCNKCGHEENLFGSGGLAKESIKSGIELLGKIPINIDLRKASDTGKPITFFDTENSCSKTFLEIGEKLAKNLQI